MQHICLPHRRRRPCACLLTRGENPGDRFRMVLRLWGTAPGIRPRKRHRRHDPTRLPSGAAIRRHRKSCGVHEYRTMVGEFAPTHQSTAPGLFSPTAIRSQADEDFTISVLSNNQVMLAYHGGISIYEIPPISASPPGRNQPRIRSVQPIWSTTCDIGEGIYRISPFTSSSGAGAPVHPLVIAGTDALHVLRIFPDSRVEHREVAHPLAAGMDIGYIGLGAVGLRRAIWDCTEARNGSLLIHFRTYSLPRTILDLGADGAAFDAEQLGPGGKLGSFSVRVEPEEHLVSVCLEEATGRVCLLLNNITTGARRISVIDVV